MAHIFRNHIMLLKRLVIPLVTSFFMLWAETPLRASNKTEQPSILNLHYRFATQGGLESHLLMFKKVCNEYGIKSNVLTSQHSTWLVNALESYGLPSKKYLHNELNPNIMDMIQASQTMKPSVIICNWLDQLDNCLFVAQHFNIDLIYMHHNPTDDFDDATLAKFNRLKAVVAVSPHLVEKLQNLQKQGQLTSTTVAHITPFWDEDRFLTFIPQRSKKQFFSEVLKLQLPDDCPIVCSAANLSWYKNHKLLLRVTHDLIYKDHKKFHLILAGDGERKDEIMILAKELNLIPYVHFVGAIQEIPELLHHVDIHVLASSHEPFGLTHLEAAVMKKPFFGATNTGATKFIQHGINGMLFENNNLEDCKAKLAYLLDNPEACKALGEQARTFVQKNYTNKLILQQWINLLGYKKTLTPMKEIPPSSSADMITIAILAKDMAHVLPTYLRCIENQTWPKEKTYLYIRTNNNKDTTLNVLRTWIDKVGHLYADVYFDDTDVPERVERFGIHEWNSERFKVLGKIRQDSVNWAYQHKSHYFVADCDNFIKPNTIEALMNSNCKAVGPLLRRNDDNNHPKSLDDCVHGPSSFYTTPPSDPRFWFTTTDTLHRMLLFQEIKGIIQVPVIHCTYLLRHEILDKVCYDDQSGNFEFIILSNTLSNHNIFQYIDTRELYGYITRAENTREFIDWVNAFKDARWLKHIVFL